MDIIRLRDLSIELIQSIGLNYEWASRVQSVLALILLLLVAWFGGRLGRKLFRYFLPKLIYKTENQWDDKLLQNNFFTTLSYYLLGIIFFYLDEFIASSSLRWFIQNLTGTFFTVITVMLLSTVLNTIYLVYKERNPKEKGNLKIYIQLIKVVIYSFAGIIIISFFANKNFIDILKGLGAMVTILLIVYKDTILGFVAGISLSANKMLEVGDWICVPQSNADGTVIEIGLNTVKVQNWDMTITTIPPYKLISDSFINWEGMTKSGGRRIKRSLNIDIDSIHFLSDEEIAYFEEFDLLRSYIQEKKQEIAQDNIHKDKAFNQRRLTNIGTFKRYIEEYLHKTKPVNNNMTFLVRQLQSNELGLPIEIYFFSREQEWAKYEAIQADIFDHIFAITQEFNLRVFQNVSASSVGKLLER